MLIISVLLKIYLIFSFVYTFGVIEALFVSIGNYPNHRKFGINEPECGLRLLPTNYYSLEYSQDYIEEQPLDYRISFVGGRPRVIFGSNASIGEAPWTVYLSYKTFAHENSFCTGVLITLEWVLTAAHCYYSRPNIVVIANAGNNNRQGLQQIKLDKNKWFRHPGYFNRTKYKPRFDVMLVKLERKFTRVRNSNKYLINTICVPQTNQINEDVETTAFFGYGFINDEGKISKHLQKAIIKLIPFNQCGYDLLCSSYSNEDSRTCYGDSGGGLVQFTDESQAILVGTLVGGLPVNSGCSKRITNDFFTVTSFYIDWILNVIQNN